MKKSMTTIVIFLLTVWVSAGAIAFADTESRKTEKFEGTRRLEVVIDKSDLENFMDGGRATLDLMLRMHTPSWAVCEIASDGVDLSVSLSFEFDSYSDYCRKIEELLTYSPNLVYSQEDGLLLLESFSSPELLNYLQSELVLRNCLNEKTLEELLKLRVNEIEINKEVYEIETNLSIRPESTREIRFEVMEVSTVCKESGAYERTITVQVRAANSEEDIAKQLVKQFKKAGKTKETALNGQLTEITVSFKANNQKELMELTEKCLNSVNSVSERQVYVDKDTVGVIRTEFFDLEGLMSEDGEFTYRYTCPSYYNAIEGRDGTVYDAETSEMVSCNESYVKFYYERGFKFSSVEIATDVSNLFGKKERIITLKAPSAIAEYYHADIMEQFKEQLVKGTTLHVYDADGQRCYEFMYSSWFMKDIERFTAGVLNQDCRIYAEDSWIPLAKSELQESLFMDNFLSDMAPADETVLIYRISPLCSMEEEMYEMDHASVGKHEIVISTDTRETVTVTYRGWNVVKTVLEVLALFIVAAAVGMLVKKIKHKTKQNVL